MNVYEIITARIIEQLEAGTIPWRKPWTGTSEGAYNRVSKKPYSFINQMLLEHTGEYATFNQWKNAGAKIKKGAKSEIVVFWKVQKKEEDQPDGTKKEIKIPVLRYYRVFHITQTEGVEPIDREKFAPEPIAAADQLISKYTTREGIDYKEQAGDQAFYSPGFDQVRVPEKNQFPDTREFYSTVFHELTHSTGHKSRLNRFSSDEPAAFGDESYSKEELIAEIGSAALCNMYGIETNATFQNSAAYIAGWLEKLRNDSQLIIAASSKAGKAVDFIIGKESEENE